MKKNFLLYCLVTLLLVLASCDNSKYKYETVPNDPLKVQIYTLENGLKIYLSVNKDKPRIQTYIGVRVGAKNDPAETTGLAHYFEHLMFKGTTNFGTSNYEAEKPLLDEIERTFEVYRQVSDEAERTKIYAKIDSLSQVASTYAIPNEYDKLMSTIGAQGTNAFTSYDVTAYVENIPSNEIDNWALIQADRFTNPVIRLFHTELETVYEEYNMSLTRDGRKVFETVLRSLFPHHPYGTQTVLGTQDHLKNPSIINIKNYFETYYVPNNMAVCMVGDFDPDEVVAIIDKYFGHMKAKEFPKLNIAQEPAIEKPIVAEVVGLEAENVAIAYRMPAANTKDAAIMEFVDYLLTNGKAGLIDLNLVQKQKVLGAGSYSMVFSDYSILQLYGMPKENQTLDEVKELLLAQIDMLKKGEFEDWLLKAVVNNFKLDQYYQIQESGYAASLLLNSYINDVPWKDQVDKLAFQSTLTKQDIMDFCNKHLKDNYVLVYKKQGEPNNPKIDKPQITPINANRDNESEFLAKIRLNKVKPIEPVFVNFKTDMNILKTDNKLEILYKQNTSNPLFQMDYVFDMGNDNDKALGTAFSYLNYLGTSKQTAEEIKSELYKIACSFSVQSTNERVYVSINGLNDNFDKAMQILEEKISDAVVDIPSYQNLAKDILKSRQDAKANQGQNFQKLTNYAKWGANSAATNILSQKELEGMNPQELVDRIKDLKNYKHRILYYGPLSENDIVKAIDTKHNVASEFKAMPKAAEYKEQPTDKPTVYLANYEANQIYMGLIHKGVDFDKTLDPIVALYNAYFGGGMNSIVFQEMREARALAYSAWAGYSKPRNPNEHYYLSGFIATQNDKMKDAITAFDEIINNMPVSEKAFATAKDQIITNIRTERVLRSSVLWKYLDMEKFGYTVDPSKTLYDNIPPMTLDNVVEFQNQYIKDKSLVYYILGDVKNLDKNYLKTLGEVKVLDQKEIFAY